MSQIETNQRLANSFVDLRHCGNNHNYLTKSNKAKCLLDIYTYPLLIIHKCMALSPPNIILSRTGTTSETIFHIYLCTNVPIHNSKDK